MRLRTTGVSAPKIRTAPSRRIVHGRTLVDEYSWLRAENWREILADPGATPDEIRAILEAENEYAQQTMAPARPLQERIIAELRGRLQADDFQVPRPDGPFEYYYRYQKGGQHRVYCRRPRGAGEDQEAILLNGDELAAGSAYFGFGAVVQAPNHSLIAWACDQAGSELYEIRVRDPHTQTDLSDCVRRADGSIVWTKSADAFYYVRVDDNHRTAQVFLHRLGEPQDADRLILEETDPGWFVRLRASNSKAFAIVSMQDHDCAECWLIDLARPESPARRVAPRLPKQRYDVEPHERDVFIRANADGAEDFKIVMAPLSDPGRENWRDVIPHRPGRLILDFAVYARFLIRAEREDGLPRLVVRDIESCAEHAIAFDEETYDLKLTAGETYDSNIARFIYSSMSAPEETYDYDMELRARALRKRQEIPSGHDPKNYLVRRIFARANDGRDIPISLLARRDQVGPAPCLLYGYGAYGYAIPAAFAPNRFSLVDRGFVYAIAHIRGGTDKGWRWYEEGKLANKPNSFSDFIRCGETLIAEGFTEKGRIVAHGGSAGGMLMGAVVNQAPDLFAGIIADVPFVDVVNTMLDADLPLTPPEWLEWGNPIEDATAFERMLAYSPYDNVKAQKYPPILAFGGLTDPRVTYWEPAKWIARLRARMTDGGPVMLVTNMKAGHGGASGRYDLLDEVAMEQAFAIAVAMPSCAGPDDD